MANKPPRRPRAPRDVIDLAGRVWINIVYEDRSILAIDKPVGWILAPKHWENTGRNLTLALDSSLAARAFWAASRNIRFIRPVHRLDADTGGVMLLARTPGALSVFSKMFETREIEKTYLAVVEGKPKNAEWECSLKIGPHPTRQGVMRVDSKEGKEALTKFRLLDHRDGMSLVEARPQTGRTHQIRVHLYNTGHPIMSDPLYGMMARDERPLALRAVGLNYNDPFDGRPVRIKAPSEEFLQSWGFATPATASTPTTEPGTVVVTEPSVEKKPEPPAPVVRRNHYTFNSGPRPKAQPERPSSARPFQKEVVRRKVVSTESAPATAKPFEKERPFKSAVKPAGGRPRQAPSGKKFKSSP